MSSKSFPLVLMPPAPRYRRQPLPSACSPAQECQETLLATPAPNNRDTAHERQASASNEWATEGSCWVT